jgi:glycosyltransferase involved in cell wall biosynthesis
VRADLFQKSVRRSADLLAGRPKVAILTNILAPYRIPIFQRLADNFEITVLLSGKEDNRSHWQPPEPQKHAFRVKRAGGFTLTWTKRDGKTALDTRYLHVNPGLVSGLLRESPDAIVTDEMGFRSLVALAYGRVFDRPVWIWWGGTPHTERNVGVLRRFLRRRLASGVNRWFSYGVTSTEYLLSLGVPRDRVIELQNCVPEHHYHTPVPPAFVLEPRPVVLCVGRLVPGKGVDLLLRAAARLQGEGLTFSILLVGDGSERQSLAQTAAELGLRNVHFRATHETGRMPAVYRSGDVLVFPTLDDVWGLVVNEAMWSGLPALVSIYAGCARELVPAASTFDPLDPTDFTRKLRMAVSGQLPAPDLSRLRRIDEVSGSIIGELDATLKAVREDTTGP